MLRFNQHRHHRVKCAEKHMREKTKQNAHRAKKCKETHAKFISEFPLWCTLADGEALALDYLQR